MLNIVNKGDEMRIAFFSIMMGCSVAVGFKDGENPSNQVSTLSIVSELMTILTFGILALS